jgi:hypothetical protein
VAADEVCQARAAPGLAAPEQAQRVCGELCRAGRRALSLCRGTRHGRLSRAAAGAQVASRLNLNSKGQGSVTLRVTSHDHAELGWSLLVPVLGALWGKLRGEDGAF